MSPSPPALRWVAGQLPADVRAGLSATQAGPRTELLAEVAASLGRLLKQHRFHQKAGFDAVALEGEPAAMLARAAGGEELEAGSQAWLNRHLLASVLKQSLGRDALPTMPPGFDEILVSDAGQPFLVLENANLGFIAQSMRASDILMDRVWHLEKANFGADPLFRFIPINHKVPREEDPTALPSVVQAEIPMIRTDLDRFSDLESRALIMHGYEVARSICSRHRPEPRPAAPALPPWDPFAPANAAAPVAPSGAKDTEDARSLRRSAARRIWSTLFDFRDWPTYVFVPLLILLFGVLPYMGWRFYEKSRRNATIVNAVAQGMPDFRKAMELIEGDPTGGWKADHVEKVATLKPADHKGWELVNDTIVLDLREFNPVGWGRRSPSYFYSNVLRVRKLPTYRGDGRLTLVYRIRGAAPEVRVRSSDVQASVKQLDGKVDVHGQPGSLTHVEMDLSQLPHGDSVSLECDFLFRDVAQVKGYWVRYKPMMPTRMCNVWLLFPTSHPYRDYKLRSFVAGQPGAPETEEPRYKIDHPYGLVIAWSMMNPSEERTYECQWAYEE